MCFKLTGKLCSVSQVWSHLMSYAPLVPLRYGSEYCLSGRCYLCEYDNITCSHQGYIEGSLQWFVNKIKGPVENPWGAKHYYRFQDHNGFNPSLCSKTRKSSLFESEEHFMNLVDFSIFDFLTYHFDSKYYYKSIGHQSTHEFLSIHLDRGRALTRHDKDDSNNIVPLKQCCKIRESTWKKMLKIHKSQSNFISSLDSVLRLDDLYPPTVIHKKQILAILRRLDKIINYVQECVNIAGFSNVVIGDS